MTIEIELAYTIHMEGTLEDAQALRDKVDDLVYEILPINCGDLECCPEPPVAGEPLVSGSFGTSTIRELEEEPDGAA